MTISIDSCIMANIQYKITELIGVAVLEGWHGGSATATEGWAERIALEQEILDALNAVEMHALGRGTPI